MLVELPPVPLLMHARLTFDMVKGLLLLGFASLPCRLRAYMKQQEATGSTTANVT